MPNVMEEFDLSEISAVDRPAQAHAKATIIKRVDDKKGKKPMDLGLEETEEDEKKGKKPAAKKGYVDDSDGCVIVLTSASEGHQHTLSLRKGANGGSTSYSSGEEEEDGSHDHPWIMNSQGQIVIGLTKGHDHSVDMAEVQAALFRATLKISPTSQGGDVDANKATDVATNKEGNHMPNDQTTELETLKGQVTELTQAKDRAEAVAALPVDQLAHFRSMDKADQDTFLSKSAEDRNSIVKAATESNPVIYKALDGSEFRKSDDPRLVSAVKAADLTTKALREEVSKRESLELEKRAEQLLPNLPGTAAVRGQLLKAIEGIADEETRKGALECLKSANGGVFERANGSPEDHGMKKGEGVKAHKSTDAEAKLDQLAEKRAKETGEPLYKAYSEVLSTPEGAKLYNEYATQHPAN